MDENQVALQLVRRCKTGDAGAWEELVRTYSRRIYNICYRFTGTQDDADDLTQDVFIRVYRTLQNYDPKRAGFPTWMATLTRNMLVDHFRRGKYDRVTDSLEATAPDDEGRSLGDQLADKSAPPLTGIERREAKELVHRALQRLSPDLREAVILRDLHDMDYQDIARVLNVPEGTVKSRIHRGRTELARLLRRTCREVG